MRFWVYASIIKDAKADGNPGGYEGMRKKFILPDDIGKGDDYMP